MPSLPLSPADDGWGSPDGADLDRGDAPAFGREPVADDDLDLDLLELRVDPHVYADLTELEYFAVSWRYGLAGSPHSMKDLAAELGCNHSEARAVIGSAIDKLRQRLLTQ